MDFSGDGGFQTSSGVVNNVSLNRGLDVGGDLSDGLQSFLAGGLMLTGHFLFIELAWYAVNGKGLCLVYCVMIIIV